MLNRNMEVGGSALAGRQHQLSSGRSSSLGATTGIGGMEKAVAFGIIWRSVSELYGVRSLTCENWAGPEEARELAMSRFRLIQPHLEKNQPLQTVAADGKVPFRTAQRWVSQIPQIRLDGAYTQNAG